MPKAIAEVVSHTIQGQQTGHVKGVSILSTPLHRNAVSMPSVVGSRCVLVRHVRLKGILLYLQCTGKQKKCPLEASIGV